MPAEGICLRVTHTGVHPDSVAIYDLEDAVNLLGVFRKAGPIYIPFEQTVEMVYTSDVAKSFEIGAIREFIDQGLLIAELFFGAAVPVQPIEVLDEGISLTASVASIDFVGSGVTATTAGDAVTVTIPGGGAATDHSLLLPASLVWGSSAHTGTADTLAGFDALGAATNYSLTITGDVSGTFPGPLSVTDLTIAGEAQGSILYFDGANWVHLPAGVSGEVLTTQGAGSDPIWASAAGAGSAVLLWGNNSVGSTTTTRYLTPSYEESLSQTIAIQFRVPRAGTFRNMRVRHNDAGGNGNSIVYTLRVNGAASALSVSLASTSADGSDLASTVAVAAGDLVDIEVTKAASVGSGLFDITCSVEFV